jgi:hypothetical protein
MRIIVRPGGDPLKAYKVLMKKLNKDNHFKTLSRKRYFMTTQEKRKEATRESEIRHKKAEELRKKTQERKEQFQIIESKRRGKNSKKPNNYRKSR